MLNASYRVVLLGGANVGKTALSIQMVCNSFVETYDPTIEDFYRKKVVVDGQSCTLEILDTGGMVYKNEEEVKNSWINSGNGFILVYSISSRASFQQALDICREIKEGLESGTRLASSSALVPIVLAGNHCETFTNREISIQEGHDYAQALGCQFVEMSAKDCINVQKPFYDIIRLLQPQRGLMLQNEAMFYKKKYSGLKSKRSTNLIDRCLKPFASWARVRFMKKIHRQARGRSRHNV